MKKTALMFVMALGLSIMFSSCKSDCCTCAGTEVCEDDYSGAGGVSWSQYKAAAKAAGCDC